MIFYTKVTRVEDMTPSALISNLYSYLGYGRIGHLPDTPHMIYRYTPHNIVKNNPDDYMQAFCQMVKAMQLILKSKLQM